MNATKSPKISVVMPVWNGERYLREAVDSILAQTFTDFEFLVIDDGSTDSTPEIVEEYMHRDKRVRLIRLPHEGIVVALNRGVQESRADWVARMDCDDIAKPGRLEMQWNAIQKKPQAVLCHTNIETLGVGPRAKPQHFPQTREMLLVRMCIHCAVVHPSVLFSKQAFFAAGGYLQSERHAEDYALWERLFRTGDFIGIPEPLLIFRIHAGSVSKGEAVEAQKVLPEIIIEHFRQQAFSDDWVAAGKLLGNFRTRQTFTCSLKNAARLAWLFWKHRLLNVETFFWLGYQFLKSVYKKEEAAG